MRKRFLPTTLFMVGLSLQAGAAFILVDDFQTNTADTAIAGWSTTTGQGGKSLTARLDPTDSGNIVAAGGNTANSNEGWVLELPGGGISSAATGTLFARFHVVNPGISIINDAFGIVDTTTEADLNNANNAFLNYEVQVVLSDTEPDIQARNGGTFTDTGNNATRGQWYNVWLVANNSTDQWSLYMNQGSAGATAGDLVGTYGFRYGTAAALSHVQITVANVGGTRSSGEAVYWDDIYFDASGANLAYAVPEPAAMAALTGLLALGLVVWRRRRRC